LKNNKSGITTDAVNSGPANNKSGKKNQATKYAKAGHILKNRFLKKLLVSTSPSCYSQSFNKIYAIKNPLRVKKISTPKSPAPITHPSGFFPIL